MRSEEERFKEAAERFLGYLASMIYDVLPRAITEEKWGWLEEGFKNNYFDFLEVEAVQKYRAESTEAAWDCWKGRGEVRPEVEE